MNKQNCKNEMEICEIHLFLCRSRDGAGARVEFFPTSVAGPDAPTTFNFTDLLVLTDANLFYHPHHASGNDFSLSARAQNENCKNPIMVISSFFIVRYRQRCRKLLLCIFFHWCLIVYLTKEIFNSFYGRNKEIDSCKSKNVKIWKSLPLVISCFIVQQYQHRDTHSE